MPHVLRTIRVVRTAPHRTRKRMVRRHGSYRPACIASMNSGVSDTELWSVPPRNRMVATPGKNARKSDCVLAAGTSASLAAARINVGAFTSGAHRHDSYLSDISNPIGRNGANLLAILRMLSKGVTSTSRLTGSSEANRIATPLPRLLPITVTSECVACTILNNSLASLCKADSLGRPELPL